MRGIKIIGTGMYVPETTVTNDWLSTILDTNDEWIYTRTGIRERRVSVDKPNFYMAEQAALAAVKNSGIDPADIDLVLAATCSPDFFYPALSCIVQHTVGAENAAAATTAAIVKANFFVICNPPLFHPVVLESSYPLGCAPLLSEC